VVATHRHKDHISGFSDAGGKKSSGAILASCHPEVVLQPWTENPRAGANATSAPLLAKNKPADAARLYFASLNAMQAYAQAVVDRAPLWRGPGGRPAGFEKLAANNTTNPDAVHNLRTMGRRKPRFLQYGDASGLENARLLPGVKVRVLGPPTLKQQNLKKYAKNSDEYWIASKYWGLQQRAALRVGTRQLFPHDARYGVGAKPAPARWFIEHADNALKNNVMAIVTILDKFLNNTSIILLFEVKGKKLLFPGDAQLENWQWALSQEGIPNLLKDVDVYKVGHHGSRNATPHSLWDHFEKRKGRQLISMMSTASGVYGRSEEGKVPSAKLVKSLARESDLRNTQDLKGAKKPMQVTV
jgi:hypothetical protein